MTELILPQKDLIGLEQQQVFTNASEVVQLGAVDSLFFYKSFFPRTCRQGFADFHAELSADLDGPSRLVNEQIFRGGAKTSFCRMYTAKRIAYGLAHTILYIGKSEGHALRSINWLRNQVDRNRNYSSIFNLRPGQKWQDQEAEIWHGTDEYPIWIMGMGITGSIRGINRDDFRPDLIVVDDVMDEENCATTEQREKIKNLLYGAIKESLAPRSEAPDAKLVMLQTPLHKEDASTEALSDPEWKSAVHGCWTKETADLPIDAQESAWAQRWSSAELRKEKRAAIARNKLSLWNREKECRITSPETSSFHENWLKYYELLPEQMAIIMVIDPVPPPSEAQIEKGLLGKDYEAIAVVGRYKDDYFVLEYTAKRGHTPSWTIAEFFRLALKWRPFRIVVESVAYQRTLAWLLREAMEHQKQYFVIQEYVDKRKKHDRIIDSLNGVAAAGHLHVLKSQSELIAQFREYPDVSHDDVLETVAIAVSELAKPLYSYMSGTPYEAEDESDYPELSYTRGAP